MIQTERSHILLGVPGRIGQVHAWHDAPGLFMHQKWTSESRKVSGFDAGGRMTVTVEFQDNPRNGTNRLYLTGEITTEASRRRRDCEVCGQMPDEIKKFFPELAPLLKWSGMSQTGPFHYIANTVYHAGDRDHRGNRKGEVERTETFLLFGDNPIRHQFGTWIHHRFIKFLQDYGPSSGYDFEVICCDHKEPGNFRPKFTFGGFATAWHECPFNSKQEALEMLEALKKCSPHFLTAPVSYSEGKERDLNAARHCAVWPDATDEQLSVEPEELKQALIDRLPGLIEEFRAVIASTGLLWEPA